MAETKTATTATPIPSKAIAPIDAFRKDLQKLEGQFKAALPPQITPEKFMRVLNTAVGGDPNLLNANRQTLWAACLRAAQDGLLPDKREAALVIFGQEVVFMPMIGGILKKIRNSGELAKVDAHVVYKNDTFRHILGDDESIQHEMPPLGTERGPAIGAYAVAHLKDGTIIREVMSFPEIEAVRAVSRAKDSGPWKGWWGEMAKKTVLRRLSKRLPMSTDIEMVIHRDDDLYDLDAKKTDPEPQKTTSSRLNKAMGVQEQDEPAQQTAADMMPDAVDAEVVDTDDQSPI